MLLLALQAGAERPDGPPPQGGDQQGDRPQGDRGPGGPGGGGYHLLPRFAEERLELTPEQRDQLNELEKEVKAKLGQILTPEQMKILQEARPPRRDGGRQGGPHGAGGPNGGGPDGGGPRRGGEGHDQDEAQPPSPAK